MFYDNVLVFYMVNVYIPIICSIYNFETVSASVLNLKIWESQANLFQESFFLKYCCAIPYIFCINLLFYIKLTRATISQSDALWVHLFLKVNVFNLHHSCT